jgi:hypothetical protein
VSDDGIEVPILGIAFGSEEIVATPEVAAGTVRILTAVPYEDFGSVIFRIPDDQPDAIEQVWNVLAQPEPVIPDSWFDLDFPGGVRTDDRYGATAEGFIHLKPGAYAVMDFATGQSTTFLASGEAADPVAIPATVEVTALDSMTYTGLESGIAAGRHLWALTNGGEMLHNITVYGTPEGVTPDDILAAMMSDDESAFDGFTGGLMATPTLSPGGVNAFYLDLPAGPYAAHCTDVSDGQSPPHFFLGMIVTFEVA